MLAPNSVSRSFFITDSIFLGHMQHSWTTSCKGFSYWGASLPPVLLCLATSRWLNSSMDGCTVTNHEREVFLFFFFERQVWRRKAGIGLWSATSFLVSLHCKLTYLAIQVFCRGYVAGFKFNAKSPNLRPA